MEGLGGTSRWDWCNLVRVDSCSLVSSVACCGWRRGQWHALQQLLAVADASSRPFSRGQSDDFGRRIQCGRDAEGFCHHTVLALLLDRFNRPMQHSKQANVRHAVGFPIHVSPVPPAVRLFANTGSDDDDTLYSKRFPPIEDRRAGRITFARC